MPDIEVLAIELAGFRQAADYHGTPTLWCVECGRDSGYHWGNCSKAATPLAPDEGLWGIADEIVQLVSDLMPSPVSPVLHREILEVIRRRFAERYVEIGFERREIETLERTSQETHKEEEITVSNTPTPPSAWDRLREE